MRKFIKDKALCHERVLVRILSGHFVSSYSSGLLDKSLFFFSMDGNSLLVCKRKTIHLSGLLKSEP